MTNRSALGVNDQRPKRWLPVEGGESAHAKTLPGSDPRQG
jgi:hypothetical protein